MGLFNRDNQPKLKKDRNIKRVKGWAKVQQEGQLYTFINTQNIVDIAVLVNKDATKFRLKLKFSGGQVLYTEPRDDLFVVYADLNAILAA